MKGIAAVKIINLTEKSKVYTSNVYLVLGTWNTIADVNTLVDVGRDLSILERILTLPTGVGKKPVAQVIITHNHFDHSGLLKYVKEVFKAVVYAYSSSLEGVDQLMKDGDTIRIADRDFEVLHTPGHSSDSICLFCRQDGVLFCGDTPVIVHSADATYERDFVNSMKKLCEREVKSIYFGHGAPMLEGCAAALMRSLEIIMNVKDSNPEALH